MKFKFKSNPKVIMGHTRMTTQGSEKINANNHPFYSKKLGFAIAHNGMLYGEKYIKKTEKLPNTDIKTNSYIVAQLIDKHNTLNLKSLKYMAEKIEGPFCFTLFSKDNELYFVKGDNPMCITHFNGFYVYASNKEILTKALKKLGLKKYNKVSTKEGEILKINTDGSRERNEFNMNTVGTVTAEGLIIMAMEGRKTRNLQTNNRKSLLPAQNPKELTNQRYMSFLIRAMIIWTIEEMLYDPALMYYCLREEELYDEM